MADNTDSAIAVLGASASGKTTFLGALYIAISRHNQQMREEGRADDNLHLVGVDSASNEILKDLTGQLTARTFPEPTVGIEEFSWQLRGDRMQLKPRQVFGMSVGKKREKVPTKITLNLADPAGGISKQPGAGGSYHQNRDFLLQKLKESRGIVFLFDPIKEFDKGETFDHTFGIILDLANEMLQSDDFDGNYLPHNVAVCISKFDEPRVLQTAHDADLLITDTDDQHSFPRVSDDDARELYQQLCKVSLSGTADLALNTVEDYFRPERIRYFVTSAIGFYMDRGRRQVDLSDYQNVIEDPSQLPAQQGGQSARIRGQVHPINVLEPILWAGGHWPANTGRRA
ncbi:MAG TPA: hypothetical protein VFI65_01900 [Streptosporangiaceae bacterium]|nr:hypothetical protein [Streptosporangiaceae bacterium]